MADTSTYTFNSCATPAYATQLRLSPELKHALLQAQATGASVSMRLSSGNVVLTVDGHEYVFTSSATSNIDLLRLDDETGVCEAVASVQGKLTLQRKVDTSITNKLAASSREAQKAKERQAQLVDVRTAKGAFGVTRSIRKQSTPEPQARPSSQPVPKAASATANGTLPSSSNLRPNKLAVSSLPSRSAPQPHQELARHGASQQAPLQSAPHSAHPLQPQLPEQSSSPHATKQPTHKELQPPQHSKPSATAAHTTPNGQQQASPLPYLGAHTHELSQPNQSRSTPPPSSRASPPRQLASAPEVPLAACKAAEKRDVQLCLAAILEDARSSGRRLSFKSLIRSIGLAYHMAGQKAEAEAYIKRVVSESCEMVQGAYLLKDEVRYKLQVKLTELHQQAQPQAVAHNISPHVASETNVHAHTANNVPVHRNASGDQTGSDSLQRDSAGRQEPPTSSRSQKKRKQIDTFDDLDGPYSQPAKRPATATAVQPAVVSAAAEPVRSQSLEEASHSLDQQVHSFPSTTSGMPGLPYHGVSPNSGGGVITPSPDSHQLLVASVQPEVDADLALYEQYVRWQPGVRPPLTDSHALESLQKEYTEKYAIYFKLHQKLAAVERDLEARKEAIGSCTDEVQKHQHQQELWRIVAKKFNMVRSWQKAFDNLHADLSSIRNTVSTYLQQAQ